MTVATADRYAEMTSVVQMHQAVVWRYLRFLGCNTTEADDLTQETFLKLFRSDFEQRSPRETAAYLRTIARNGLLMARRAARENHLSIDLDAAEAVWSRAAAEDGLDGYLVALRECLEVAVSTRVREALDLHYRDGASRDEIAASLDLAVEGVKTMLRRARTALRDCVERKIGQ